MEYKTESTNKESPFHPLNIDTYKDIPSKFIPNTESLMDTFQRTTEYFKLEIMDKIKDGNILISAHGNSIRALCKFLFKLDEKQITKLEIPTGNPLLININKNLQILNCNYLDKDRARDLLVF